MRALHDQVSICQWQSNTWQLKDTLREKTIWSRFLTASLQTRSYKWISCWWRTSKLEKFSKYGDIWKIWKEIWKNYEKENLKKEILKKRNLKKGNLKKEIWKRKFEKGNSKKGKKRKIWQRKFKKGNSKKENREEIWKRKFEKGN